MTDGLATVRRDIARFIRSGIGDFDTLALRLFRAQVAENDDYRAIVGDGASRVARVIDLPAVPVALWRDLSLVSFPLDRTRVVFRTSGTTGRRGQVHRHDTELYDLGARAFAESVVGPIPSVGVSLVPDAPDSSLGHMCRTFAPGLSQRFTGTGGVDADGAWADLRRMGAAGVPVFLPGTALALAALVAVPGPPVALPPGSIVMVTGGFKGQVVAVSAAELRATLQARLPGAEVVEEYGMTELSSQMWAEGPGLPLRLPPWLRVQVVDPLTGAPAEVGLLRFIDLANVDTVLAIETRDVGRRLPDGRLELRGRLPGAPARGCSLTVEEAMDVGPPSGPRAPEPPYPRVERPCSAPDRDRVRRLVGALAELPPLVPAWGQGVPPASAARELAAAVAALDGPSLERELGTVPPDARPRSVAIVAAEGVFTAALEWVVLCLAAGVAVRWKPPRRWPAFAEAVGAVLQRHGFPLTVDPGRALGAPDVVVAFGTDATVDALRREVPGSRVVGYGHRHGIAVVQGPPTAAAVRALWDDHRRFDTRGCMAPAGVWVLDADPRAWGLALAQAAERGVATAPRGALSPADGPEWRRRVALGRALGGAWEGRDWAVAAMPPEPWVPAALPWFVSLVDVGGVDAAQQLLAQHAARVSVLARPEALAGAFDAAVDRTCALGQMQAPPFPRRHDGHPMLARVCGWRG